MKIILIAFFCLTMFGTMTSTTLSEENIQSTPATQQQTFFDLYPIMYTIHCIACTILIYREIALSNLPMFMIANP